MQIELSKEQILNILATVEHQICIENDCIESHKREIDQINCKISKLQDRRNEFICLYNEIGNKLSIYEAMQECEANEKEAAPAAEPTKKTEQDEKPAEAEADPFPIEDKPSKYPEKKKNARKRGDTREYVRQHINTMTIQMMANRLGVSTQCISQHRLAILEEQKANNLKK